MVANVSFNAKEISMVTRLSSEIQKCVFAPFCGKAVRKVENSALLQQLHLFGCNSAAKCSLVCACRGPTGTQLNELAALTYQGQSGIIFVSAFHAELFPPATQLVLLLLLKPEPGHL